MKRSRRPGYTPPVTHPTHDPPDEVTKAAAARAAARASRDWARADALRAEIEAAGWKVVDNGSRFRLEPAAPPTVEEEGRTRYGSAAAVPSALEEAATARFTVELLADDWPEDLARMLAGLRAHAPDGTQGVIVANDPSPAQAARLEAASRELAPIAGAAPEVVWTSVRLGYAAARNVGLRLARGAIVVLADTSVDPSGDALTPLEAALADPAVAVAGPDGFVTRDFRRFEDAPGPDADAVGMLWLAFRRSDFRALGPLDERFAFHRSLDVWWSLVLRTGVDPERPPRAARRVEVPLDRHDDRGWTRLPDADRDRQSRRNFYLVLDRFRDRQDLRSGAR